MSKAAELSAAEIKWFKTTFSFNSYKYKFYFQEILKYAPRTRTDTIVEVSGDFIEHLCM